MLNAPAIQQRSFKLMRFQEPLCEVVELLRAPTGTEVVVRIRACGVCHSDLHLIDGHFDLGGGQVLDLAQAVSPPRILGHEIAGEVVALGPDATGVALGDRRIVFPWIGCGTCAVCARGDEHLCSRPHSLGTTADGGFSDHVVVPHPRFLLAYDPLPPPFAATLACSGLTAYSALLKAGDLTAEPILIIGAGGVGLAALKTLLAMGGRPPIVADIDPAKRLAAMEAGAAEALDPADRASRKRILVLSDGGVGAAIDFVGAKSSVEFGLSVLRKGGRLIVVGLFGGGLELPIPTIPIRAIAIEGSFVGSLTEMEALLQLARAGKLDPIPIETRSLASVQATLDDLRAGRIKGRAVVEP